MLTCPSLSTRGFTPLIVIIAATIAISTGIITYTQKGKLQDYFYPQTREVNTTALPSPLSSPSPSSSPSISPSASPSISPSVSPKPTSPAPSTSPKPVVAPPPATNGPPPGGYSRLNVATERGNFTAHVVVLEGSTMVTDTASDSDCQRDCPTLPLAEYVSRNGGFAGINGTYFCPAAYPECADKKDSFDFSIYNSRLNKWVNQGQLSWNGRSIVYQDGGGRQYKQNANEFGGGLLAGIVNYPGILNNGHITVEAPSLSQKQGAKGTKGGIGINGSKVYLVIALNVDMYDFAHVFKSLGATHALNLDGGGSAALWYGGYKVGPGRNLPNAIVFK